MLDWTTISSDPTDFKAMEAVKDYLAAISHVIDRPWNCKHSSFSQFCDQWLFAQFDRAGPLLDIGFADHTCDPKAPAWRHGRLRAMVENCCGLDLNAERVATIQKTTQLERLIAGDFTQNPALPFDQFPGFSREM
jgi:hypothetical protein